MDAQAAVLRRQFGMVGAPGATRVREDEDALGVVHEGLRLGEIGRTRAVLDGEAIDAVRSGLADDPARAARHLGHQLRAEALDDLVERAMDRRQRRQLLDQAITAGDGLAALHGLAIAIDRPRGEIALAVGEGLVELGREAVRQIIQHVLARSDVDLNVAPFLGRNLGKAALHQRLAGRDDLDHRGMASRQIALDGGDQRRRLHRRDQMIEETLLGALESRPRGGFGLRVQRARFAGDVGRLQRGVEIVVDDAERPGIGVVDADLLVGEPVLDQLIFDALVAERAGRIEAERLHVARQDLHGRDAAGLDRLDELGPRGEGEILAAPEAEPLGIGEIVDGGGAGRRDIDDARVRQRVLKAKPGTALLRGGLVAAFSLAAGGVLHGMALVENDDPVEIGAQPFDDLPDPRNLLVARVGA